LSIEVTAETRPDPALLFPDLVFTENSVAGPDGSRAWLEPGPAGAGALSHSQGGRTIRLTSALNPAAEDRSLVDSLDLAPGEGVLCFGLGLGYHLEELHRRLPATAPLRVLEARPALATAALRARDLEPLFRRPGFRLLVGPFKGGLPSEPRPPARVLWRPATRRHFAAEYPAAWAAPCGKSRRRAKRRLLLFKSGYYLERELARAAGALGLETDAWNFPRTLTGRGDSFRELLDIIRNFRPDLALTVNHLGFDAEGLMDDLFTRLDLPAASWFVDSPVFILGSGQPSPLVSAFTWDRDYLDFLKSRGFSRVRHLPLAADEELFRPAPAAPERPVAFVGDSMTAATEKYLGKLAVPGPARPSFLKAIDARAEAFLADRVLLPDPEPLARLAEARGLAGRPDLLTDLQALVTWRASRKWRLMVLRGQEPGLLHAAGDSGWRELLNLSPDRLAGALDYYNGLAAWYRASAVNLNITSAQMKTGLNQRVFDVPAAGAFLLTDRRDQLFDLFEDGREVVTYQSPEEAARLAAWFAERPIAREKITRAARARVMGAHLYRHRLAELLAALD
jgi:spore maturation protein CgeB